MRPEKKIMVDEIAVKLKKANPVILTRFTNVGAQAINRLRALSKKQDATFMVVKKSLFDIAAKEVQLGEIKSQPEKNAGLVLGRGDSVAIVKVLAAFAKENEGFSIEGGILDEKPLSQDQFTYLASLPSREVLIAKLVGQINAPISCFVGGLGGMLRNLVGVLAQIKEQKEKN